MKIFKRMKVLEIFTVLFFIVDRISKLWALTLSQLVPTLALSGNSFIDFSWIPDLYFTLVFNKGISWGVLNNQGAMLFIFITALICIVTLWLLRYLIFKYRTGLSIFPECLVFFGSLSNIFDRFFYGGVIDFILVDFGSWSFPVFNLADCAIVMGILLMVVNLLFYDSSENDHYA